MTSSLENVSHPLVRAAVSRCLQAILESLRLQADGQAIDLSTQEAIRSRFSRAAERYGIDDIALPPPSGPLMSSMPTCRCNGESLYGVVEEIRIDAFSLLEGHPQYDARLRFAELRHSQLEGDDFLLEGDDCDHRALEKAKAGVSPATQAKTWQPVIEAAGDYPDVRRAMKAGFDAVAKAVEQDLEEHRDKNARIQALKTDVSPRDATSALAGRAPEAITLDGAEARDVIDFSLDNPKERPLVEALRSIGAAAKRGGPLSQAVVVDMLALRLSVPELHADYFARADRLVLVVPQRVGENLDDIDLTATIAETRRALPRDIEALVMPGHISPWARRRFETIASLSFAAEMDSTRSPGLKDGIAAPPSVVIIVTPEIDVWRNMASRSTTSAFGIMIASPHSCNQQAILSSTASVSASRTPALKTAMLNDPDPVPFEIPLIPYNSAVKLDRSLATSDGLLVRNG